MRWLATLVLSLASAAAHAAGTMCIGNAVIQFGNVAVGASATARTTISNCGATAWSFTNVATHPSTGPGFSIDSSCTTGKALAPGQACNLDIRFAPTQTGQTSGGV